MDKAYKLLLEPEQKKRAVDVISAGREYIEHTVREHFHFGGGVLVGQSPPCELAFTRCLDVNMTMLPCATKQMKEKKKQLKKDGKPVFVEEDDPEMVMRSHPSLGLMDF